jgi:LEA14-like dessication related protein
MYPHSSPGLNFRDLLPLILGIALSVILGLANSCKSPPSPLPPPIQTAPEEAPRYTLSYDRIEAERPGRVSLYYTLRGENAPARLLGLEIRDWHFLLNNEDWEGAAEVTAGEGGEGSIKVELELPEEEGDFDEYLSEFEVTLAGSNRSLKASAAFPRIREPEFTITSIAIVKAELVNTEFKVELRIDNPNIFPVELSSLGYELYGRGRFWAGGRERNILKVPARGYAETKLFLVMNFIDMKRDLLDEVIALGRVPYRFAGEALVDTGVPLLPSFRMKFDRSGTSEVIQ